VPAPANAPARPVIFSMLFGVVYALCFYFNWPLFAYYPQVNEFHFSGQLLETSGPPILWYGWMATAALASGVAAVIVPRGVAARVSPTIAWIVPAATIVVILIYEKRWFF
jgi:hypothetical protein